MADRIIHKTFKYRIYPTKAQRTQLENTLLLCCELYNAALQERRDAWRINHESVNFAVQSAQLPDIKEGRQELNSVYSQVLQDVLHRVDKTFKAFFGRVKQKEKVGYPRFRSRSRYGSFTYPQLGFSIQGSRLSMAKIGKVKIKLHRAIEGKIKTVTIKREAGRFYACFAVECEVKPQPSVTQSVGIDVGLSTFATLSDGTPIENPRYQREAQARIRRAQRKVARRKKGSHRRCKAVSELQRAFAHVRQQRADFHHKESRKLINKYGLITVENLNIRGLARGLLAKSVTDAGWSAFIAKLCEKAAEAARTIVKVDPRGTSQRCPCGADVPKTLTDRWHKCERCGMSVSRDHASALEILRLGLSLQDITWPVAACVS